MIKNVVKVLVILFVSIGIHMLAQDFAYSMRGTDAIGSEVMVFPLLFMSLLLIVFPGLIYEEEEE